MACEKLADVVLSRNMAVIMPDLAHYGQIMVCGGCSGIKIIKWKKVTGAVEI